MDIEHLLNTYSLYLLLLGSILLVLFAIIALKAKKLGDEGKKVLFLSIVIATLIPTIVMSASTVYLNVISSSGGPVHWHADFEVWSCGREIDLKDPEGWLSNKIGTATLHEHNDKRIHLEGVVLKPEDASLGKFFDVVGGTLTPSSYSIPTSEGMLTAQNGDSCQSGSGEVQVFAYRTDKDNYYSQVKLPDPQNYIIAPFSSVPVGDCIIVEFDVPKERTEKMCRSYIVAEEIGKLKGEKPNGN